MNSLFSIFNPDTGLGGLALNWGSLLIVLALPSGFWLNQSKPATLIKSLWLKLAGEVRLGAGAHSASAIPLSLVSIFGLVVSNNLFGLLPYVFTASSHPAFTCSIAFSTWSGYMLYSTCMNPGHFLAHLAPVGTPKSLIPFMVLIELVSSLIRPLTLAVRLAANMIAGHLLLVLTSGPLPSAGFPLLLAALAGLLALLVLELGVAFIQGYVFMNLSSLYVGEAQAGNL